jgi:hypothetical protein
MSFETHTLKGFSFRELSVLEAMSVPAIPADIEGEALALARVRQMGFVLSACLLGESGERLYPDSDAALAGIPASRYPDMQEVYLEIMRMSGMLAGGGEDSKNG